MYAFKVVATTLQFILMIIIISSAFKADTRIKYICGGMFLICAMSVIAIWG